MSFRVGIGFDVHQLAEGYDLWLGGIKVPHSKGAVGHSDADVILHAICDALLGALALGDIGKHFPDTDDRWKGADSKKLLEHVVGLVREKGYRPNNVDCALCLEKPKIAPHIPQMVAVIAGILELDQSAVSIKATTNEKMGYVGREEGVNAQAIVSLSKV
jgi:2-C-methyl-D-erythritol 2,4-cyclodiphosphate synthase